LNYIMFFKKMTKKGQLVPKKRFKRPIHAWYIKVWWDNIDEIFHVVNTNWSTQASCTCKKFEEIRILCFHILKMFNMFCVKKIPEKYILNR